jgi:hypothetical protein
MLHCTHLYLDLHNMSIGKSAEYLMANTSEISHKVHKGRQLKHRQKKAYPSAVSARSVTGRDSINEDMYLLFIGIRVIIV